MANLSWLVDPFIAVFWEKCLSHFLEKQIKTK